MALAPPTPQQLERLRGDFTPEYYINLINTKGYPVTWEEAMACPNRIGDKKKHRADCTLCEGREYIYFNPQNIRVHMQSISLKETWREVGRFDLGTAQVTSLPGDRLSYYDRLTLTESRTRYTEPMQRAPKGTADKLRYAPLDVTRLVDVEGKEYTQDLDYTLVGRSLTWARGKGPASFYSIAYFYRPVFIVLDLVHAFRDTPVKRVQGQVEMPVQCIARLDYLVNLGATEADEQ